MTLMSNYRILSAVLGSNVCCNDFLTITQVA